MAAEILVKNLSKYYNKKAAIHELNFHIKEGEVVGFLGPNGAGKSTTLRILAGLLPATSGCVYINQHSLTTHSSVLKEILGYMPENNPLPDDLRVEEYLRFRAHLKEVKNITQTVNEVMERCDLQRTAAKKMIKTLSKGFRQRVGIADALLGKPQLIILDEPTIGLDPQQIIGIRHLIDQIKEEATVIFSSHILPEIEAACNHLLILHQGELVADGTSDQLRKQCFNTIRYHLVLQGEKLDFCQRLQQTQFPFHCLKQLSKGSITEFLLETPSSDENVEADFNIWLFQQGYRVCQFTKQIPSLEALFLKLTQFSWKAKDSLL